MRRTLESPAAALRAAAFLVTTLIAPAGAAAQAVPSPEAHFGFTMGADEHLARWDEILAYFTVVADGSDRMRVDTLGPTTLGNPFVVVTLSSPDNLARLDDIRRRSAEIARGEGSEDEARALAAALPVTAVINHNIHSTEIASSQTSVDLVYRLATADDPLTREILDKVVTVLIPSTNPDGQIMVTDWYRRNLGTEWEDARMPYLYHHYAGHDNNRDYFQGNLVETRYWMDLMFHRAYPQLYLDQHQMGTTGPRIFVPPYPDPMDPDIHPLQWQSQQQIGGGIVTALQRAGKKGVITERMYRIWGQEGALTGRHHNIVALLTESASANIASPVTVTREELERGARRLGPGATYDFATTFADPWWGGTWHLGDIVSYQTIAALAFLEQAARFREDWVMGRWQMAHETVARVQQEGPYAFVVPADQPDPVAAADMMRRLALQGIEVHRAAAPFTAPVEEPRPRPQTGDPADLAAWRGEDVDSAAAGQGDEGEATGAPEARTFAAGTWVVLAAQPSWAAVEDLLMPQDRPVLYEYPQGPFLRSYDGAGYTMPLQMGVETLLAPETFEAELEPVDAGHLQPPAAILPDAKAWFGLPTRVARSYAVANRLLEDEREVYRAPGYFLVRSADAATASALREAMRSEGVPVVADPRVDGRPAPLTRARIGVYQGWAASMDEGWTRFLLETYDFDVRALSNDDVRDGLSGLDVLIVPDELSLDRLVNGADEEAEPEGYRGGIGDEGVQAIEEFVRAGGTLITLDRADALAIERLGVPVGNALDGVGPRDVFTPASIYRLDLDPAHPLADGSPEHVAAKWAGGRAYEPSDFEGRSGPIHVVGRWPEAADSILMSGLLVGGEHLAGKAALLDVEYGAGHIYMYGFRVQHRAQTTGTFRLLFNALFGEGRPAMDG